MIDRKGGRLLLYCDYCGGSEHWYDSYAELLENDHGYKVFNRFNGERSDLCHVCVKALGAEELVYDRKRKYTAETVWEPDYSSVEMEKA
jgi:hypothetical protein